MTIQYRLQVLCIFVILGLQAAGAVAVTFSAPLASTRWNLDNSVFACKLYQKVDLYGEAVFMRRAGESQRFYLQANNRQLAPGLAQLAALAPPWRSVGQVRPLGKVPVTDGAKPVQLSWQRSQTLMDELQQGWQLRFSRRAWDGNKQPVNVVLEPIRFRVAFHQYQQCLTHLLPVNYDQIRRSAVYFAGATDEFSDKQRQLLDNLARYVRADKHVTALYVDGHTDGAGLRADNLALSKRRAEAVVAYLAKRGIPENLITVRWHGERYPVASNRTKAGRAKNRRVTVRVDRFEPDSQTVAQNSP